MSRLGSCTDGHRPVTKLGNLYFYFSMHVHLCQAISGSHELTGVERLQHIVKMAAYFCIIIELTIPFGMGLVIRMLAMVHTKRMEEDFARAHFSFIGTSHLSCMHKFFNIRYVCGTRMKLVRAYMRTYTLSTHACIASMLYEQSQGAHRLCARCT